MSARAAIVPLAAWCIVASLAGCATRAATPEPVEDPEPLLLNRPLSSPLVEYPPVAPVARPEVVETPPPRPAPSVAMGAPPAAVAPVPAPPITLPPRSPPVTVQEPSIEDQLMTALLTDLQRYGNLATEDVRREIGIATQLLTRQRTDHNRVRLAMLYSIARTQADDQRALLLFDNVIKGSAANGSSVKALAAILQLQVAERVRAVRDEQRKAEVAVQKLEALREMERSLLRDRLRSGGGGGGGGGGGR